MSPEDEDGLLLHAWHDGELSPGEALALERRLAADPALRARAARLAALSGALRGTLGAPPVPATLRARVVRAIGFAEATPRAPSRRALAATLAAGIVAGGVLGGGGVYLGVAPGTGPEAAAAEAVLAGHLRGLAAPQPFDVASGDGHVVKPWFNGRTTIAPAAPDLAEAGFPLLGGRVDVVGGRPVPTLVYQRRRHVISVTILPRSLGLPPVEERRDGSNLLRWDAGDLTYWAVSDLNARELRAFADLHRARSTSPG